MNFQSPITHNNEKLGTVGTTSLVDINDNNNKVNIETTSGSLLTKPLHQLGGQNVITYLGALQVLSAVESSNA